MTEPANYEDFRDNYLPNVLRIFGPEVAAFLQNGTDADRDLSNRAVYVALNIKIKNPGMALPEMLYRMYYELYEMFLEKGHPPEAVLEQLKGVSWDTLPGMDGYARETLNSIAIRAFTDAAAKTPFQNHIS